MKKLGWMMVFFINVGPAISTAEDISILSDSSGGSYSTLSGKVTDAATGNPIAGAVVKLGTKFDTTDSEGKYSIDSVSSGVKAVSVSAPGYESKTVSVTIPDTSDSFDIQLTAKRYVKLSGMIVDSLTGDAIAGAIVKIGALTDTVAADGQFIFDTLQKGTKSVSVTANGYYQKTISVNMPDSNFTIFIELSRIIYSTLSGTIIDSVTGNPVEGAIVRIGTTRIDTVQADGKFSFDSLQRGRTQLVVTANGYYQKTVTITMPDSNISSNIMLQKVSYCRISGNVVDSVSGNAIGKAVVQFYLNFTFIKSDTADENGKYEIDSIDSRNLPSGYLYVAIPGYGYKIIKVPTTIVDTGTIDIQLTGVINAPHISRGTDKIIINHDQVIIKDIDYQGMITIFNMRGEKLVAEPFFPKSTFRLNLGSKLTAGSYMIVVNRKNGVFYKSIMLY